jgi:hypothetical protein
MGYDLHITRALHWTESESAPITLKEWVDYATSDPEMRMDNFAEATTARGDLIRIEELGIAVWTAYSGHGVGGNLAWFSYWRGEVCVKNPDQEIISKMRQIARALQARVMGDEGEVY